MFEARLDVRNQLEEDGKLRHYRSARPNSERRSDSIRLMGAVIVQVEYAQVDGRLMDDV